MSPPEADPTPVPPLKSRLTHADERVALFLVGFVDVVREHARLVVWGTLALTALLAVFTALRLGINSDNMSLIHPDLPFMVNQDEFSQHFPVLDSALLVVVDAQTPELARESADALRERMAARTEFFEDVYVPGGSRFFEEHGLLYSEVDELYDFSDGMARMQPLIAELERDASIANFARIVRLGLDAVNEDGEEGEEWPAILEAIGSATTAVYAEYPIAVSWEEVLIQDSALDVPTRRVIVAHPKLDFGNLLAAGRSMDSIREDAAALGLEEARGVTVRITGNPALNYEEMIGLLWDIGAAGAFCFALVALLVYRALRAKRLVVGVLGTLIVGLIWTAAFAAAAVGALNLASVSFAILFIGLGVDFGIHLGMRYADLFARTRDNAESLRGAVRDVGGSLVLCTVTTALGFYVFVPTEFLGVSELGLVSGTGMLVILVLTLTFFPALLSTWLALDPEKPPTASLRFTRPWWHFFERHPRAVRWTAAAFGLGGILLVPRAWFEPNVVNMRDPTTESVSAFEDLLADTGFSSPWFVNGVAQGFEEAEALAVRARELEAVDSTLILTDFVPEAQDEKLEVLDDLAFLLETPPPAGGREPRPAVEHVEALAELHDFLGAEWIAGADSPLAESMRALRGQLADFLARVAREGDEEGAVAALDHVLLSRLPDQIARLRAAIGTSGITLESLPPELRRRMLSPEGLVRVQIFSSENLQARGAMERFSDAVGTVVPKPVGIAYNLVGLGRVTVASFQQALFMAIVGIALLLFLLWGKIGEAAVVLAPLLLGAVLTVATMVLLDVPFSFFNVIVIPLLFGVGVDSGIHLVHQAQLGAGGQRGPATGEDLLGSTTARAVFYSALTTTGSFGSLAFSDHIGMRSLGILLTIGMVLTVICNLIVLPALLDLRGSGGAEARATLPETADPA
jgi:hopanoid biosynthesis associated RND transporter like protein HpnN